MNSGHDSQKSPAYAVSTDYSDPVKTGGYLITAFGFSLKKMENLPSTVREGSHYMGVGPEYSVDHEHRRGKP